MNFELPALIGSLLENPYVRIGLIIAFFLIVFFILKSIVKASILAIIFFIFIKVLFLWTPQEFTENFKINTFFKQEFAQKINNGYESFYIKRQATSPIDEDNLRLEMDKTEESAKSSVVDIFDKIIEKK